MRHKHTLLLLALATITLLPGCFRTREDIAKEREEKEMRASLQQSALESSQNTERMQAEVGRLQGKIEELEFQRKKEIASYSNTREASDKSAAELRVKLDEMQKSQAMLFDEMKRLKEENLALIKEARKPPPPPAPVPGKKGGGFESALNAYKNKSYGEAASGFRAFSQSNPKSKKVLDAHFYAGDSLYRQKEYTDAIMEFSVVQEKSPASTLGRKSTLRIAESFKALGKDKDAKTFAQILVQSSPNSAEAKQARKFLK